MKILKSMNGRAKIGCAKNSFAILKLLTMCADNLQVAYTGTDCAADSSNLIAANKEVMLNTQTCREWRNFDIRMDT